MKTSNCLNYKDYIGSIEFSEEDGVFHGKVIGVRGLVSYEGKNTNDLEKDFQDSIDFYLSHCSETHSQLKQHPEAI